uniref:Uncharacterized protein n=1 Tax=Cacopsylla melanoneura TaxID=428564 RepID=A0A8D8W1Y1_9HEMI
MVSLVNEEIIIRLNMNSHKLSHNTDKTDRIIEGNFRKSYYGLLNVVYIEREYNLIIIEGLIRLISRSKELWIFLYLFSFRFPTFFLLIEFLMSFIFRLITIFVFFFFHTDFFQQT